MPREYGIYVVLDGMGTAHVAKYWDKSFWMFGCDEPFHYFPSGVPEEYLKYPSNYVVLVVREIVVEELYD